MKIWQILAIPVCIGIWLFIAAANLDAMSALAGDAVLFDQYGVTITAQHAYAVVSLSADALLAISAVAVFWQAERRHWMRATFAALAWVICAAVSWHSMWLWLGKNQHGNIVESTQSKDVYAVTKQQLDDAQRHYSWLTQTKTSKMGPKTLRQHRETVQAAEQRLDELRKQLANTDIKVAAQPIPYFDVAGATLLLILNTICWPGIFGPRHHKVAAVAAPEPVQVAALQHAPPSPPPSVQVAAVAAPETSATKTEGGGKNLNEIRSATRVAAPATTSATIAPPEPPPDPPPSPPPAPEDPPPPPATKGPPPAADGNVVVLSESQGVAVKRWRRARMTEDASSFTKSSDLWDDYQRHGGMDMRRDEFYRALSVELGGPVKKKIGRGYEGVRLAAEARRQSAT